MMISMVFKTIFLITISLIMQQAMHSTLSKYEISTYTLNILSEKYNFS